MKKKLSKLSVLPRNKVVHALNPGLDQNLIPDLEVTDPNLALTPALVRDLVQKGALLLLDIEKEVHQVVMDLKEKGAILLPFLLETYLII